MGGLLSVAETGRPDGDADADDDSNRSRWSNRVDCKQFLREANGRLSDFYERDRDLGEGAYGEVSEGHRLVVVGGVLLSNMSIYITYIYKYIKYIYIHIRHFLVSRTVPG